MKPSIVYIAGLAILAASSWWLPIVQYAFGMLASVVIYLAGLLEGGDK